LKRVLIVDDDPRLRMLVRHTVETSEVRVLEAGDGEMALAIARAERPDVVILDWAMPRLCGIDACRQLRADPATRSIAVVMLTARAQPFDRAAATAAGVDDYLVKPFSPLELLDKLHGLGVGDAES
jgi:two-component system phosphate regulon response regulator PhoB